jgi:transposase
MVANAAPRFTPWAVTAKLIGLDHVAYLRHVIARIARYLVNRVDELLPWVVADPVHTDPA